MNWDKLVEANAAIKTTSIKGKDYAEVPQRIKAFRMVYPTGFIITELLSNQDGVAYFKAQCGYYDEAGNPFVIGTGHAYEKESGSFINKTSYIENCETSAVGRALGMAGFGIDVSVASAEEVQNAILNQAVESAQPEIDYAKEVTPAQYREKKKEPITIDQMDSLMDLVPKYPEVADYIAQKYNGVQNMTKAQADAILRRIAERENAGK